MILDTLLLEPSTFTRFSGWQVKPEGLCKDERCVPVPVRDDRLIDVEDLAKRLNMPIEHDEAHGLWAVGPEAGGHFLASAVCPDIVLPDLDGVPFSVSSLRGQKVLVVTWASWCGCRLDLPVWNELRAELHPLGLEIVTVAEDVGGPEAVRDWIEAAKPQHPSLIDTGHVLAEMLGIVNVPSGVWIDEDGMLVRPVETAPALSLGEMFDGMGEEGSRQVEAQRPDAAPEKEPDRLTEMIEESRRLNLDRAPYQAALRDWVERGAHSPYALSPDEVVARSRPRPVEVARAAACFELGQHLHRNGDPEGAVRWFQQAHHLQPDNWSYRRQAWSLVDPLQGPHEGLEREWPYEGDWLTDWHQTTPDEYYPPAAL